MPHLAAVYLFNMLTETAEYTSTYVGESDRAGLGTVEVGSEK
ncbi:MAG: hypothetical protein ACXW2A_04210 [Burkholderiales bacterium]